MNKTLFAMFVLWFFLLLAAGILFFADRQENVTCDKLITVSPADELNGIVSPHSDALRFPVL